MYYCLNFKKHRWAAIAYAPSGSECAWRCIDCKIQAQLHPGENMFIRNNKFLSILPSVNTSQLNLDLQFVAENSFD
jgi:hypothetical protein